MAEAMVELGLVTHRFILGDGAQITLRGAGGDIQSVRRYSLDDASPPELAWYETSRFVPAAATETWTGGAGDIERMSFRLRREVAAPSAVLAEPPWLYVVHTDVPDDVAGEYNAWYDEEHLPRLVRVPGIVRARRYASPDAHPRYLTAYELTDRHAFTSPEGLAARKTPWTERMRALFSNTRRFTGRLQKPH